MKSRSKIEYPPKSQETQEYIIRPLDEGTDGIFVETRGNVLEVFVKIQVIKLDQGGEIPAIKQVIVVLVNGESKTTKTDESGIVEETLEFQASDADIQLLVAGTREKLVLKREKEKKSQNSSPPDNSLDALLEQLISQVDGENAEALATLGLLKSNLRDREGAATEILALAAGISSGAGQDAERLEQLQPESNGNGRLKGLLTKLFSRFGSKTETSSKKKEKKRTPKRRKKGQKKEGQEIRAERDVIDQLEELIFDPDEREEEDGEVRAKLEEAEAKKILLEEKLAAAQEELERVNTEAESSASDNKALEEKLSKLSQEVEELKEALEQSKASNQQKIEMLSEQVSKLEQKGKDLRSEIEKKEEELKNTSNQEEIDQLNEQIEKLKQEEQEQKEKLRQKEDELRKEGGENAMEEINMLNNRIREMEEELEELRKLLPLADQYQDASLVAEVFSTAEKARDMLEALMLQTKLEVDRDGKLPEGKRVIITINPDVTILIAEIRVQLEMIAAEWLDEELGEERVQENTRILAPLSEELDWLEQMITSSRLKEVYGDAMKLLGKIEFLISMSESAEQEQEQEQDLTPSEQWKSYCLNQDLPSDWLNHGGEIIDFFLFFEIDAETDWSNEFEEKVKKAYREKAQIHHPDIKGGDEETFKRVSKADSVLRDQSRAEKYMAAYQMYQSLFSNPL
jgi:myosin heavy subunit